MTDCASSPNCRNCTLEPNKNTLIASHLIYCGVCSVRLALQNVSRLSVMRPCYRDRCVSVYLYKCTLCRMSWQRWCTSVYSVHVGFGANFALERYLYRWGKNRASSGPHTKDAYLPCTYCHVRSGPGLCSHHLAILLSCLAVVCCRLSCLLLARLVYC